ncbi:MAG TPA: tRNA (adenosine(37)-N6)-threonylcarbamoyltransferase complex dimerization subunit type 1 TsaB [Actinomycetales bacterium]|nr:tRNA (adenosine(37)-N6)-threonylcarbamoyltransferase complex dimerization subunit type 1 TsaB [Actinomycetales bacterium]
MLLLALDTATPAVTVALLATDGHGERVLAQSTVHDPRRHGELLAPGIEAVLREAGATRTDLTDVVAGTGPGPFTGLRVGLVTARVLATTLGLRLHGVGTLDALAFHALQQAPRALAGGFVVATDARRKEVYWARYAGQGDATTTPRVQRVDGPNVSRPADVPVDGLPVVGRGAQLYPEALLGRADAAPTGPLDPSAAALAAFTAQLLAAGATLDDTAPQYLRRPDVTESAGRKSVLG